MRTIQPVVWNWWESKKRTWFDRLLPIYNFEQIKVLFCFKVYLTIVFSQKFWLSYPLPCSYSYEDDHTRSRPSSFDSEIKSNWTQMNAFVCLCFHQVLCACASPCDNFVVSGSSDSTIRVWRLTTGLQLALFDACVDVIQITVWEDVDDRQPRVAALSDRRGKPSLMLFKMHNFNGSCSQENFWYQRHHLR